MRDASGRGIMRYCEYLYSPTGGAAGRRVPWASRNKVSEAISQYPLCHVPKAKPTASERVSVGWSLMPPPARRKSPILGTARVPAAVAFWGAPMSRCDRIHWLRPVQPVQRSSCNAGDFFDVSASPQCVGPSCAQPAERRLGPEQRGRDGVVAALLASSLADCPQ